MQLYARAHEYGEVRTFAVERVQKMEVLDQGFEIPADFSPSEYARSAFGIFGGRPETIELVFPASLAGYIRERNWHESQVLTDEPDGGLRLALHVAPSFDLKAWVKGFLPNVRVLRPASLRDEIAREIEAPRAAFPAPGSA